MLVFLVILINTITVFSVLTQVGQFIEKVKDEEKNTWTRRAWWK